MQGVAAKNGASYDLSRARASVTGQTTIAASTATTPLPNGRIVTALFAGALFLSAFLLFVLEPKVAKSILPTLGGTPMVWNTRLRRRRRRIFPLRLPAHLRASVWWRYAASGHRWVIRPRRAGVDA